MKVIRDPVHGDIKIRDTFAAAVIDHPIFQRLRKISQTGLCQFVFPGMRHSRFEHSLGAYHLANQYFDGLVSRYCAGSLYPCSEDVEQFAVEKTNEVWGSALHSETVREEWRSDFSLAALLHDVGHGPYSHTFEKSGLLSKIGDFKSHEELSVRYAKIILDEVGLESRRVQHVLSLIDSNHHQGCLGSGEKQVCRLLRPLISSAVDVDRLDYISRDSLMAGVNYGSIEVQRTLDIIAPIFMGDQVVLVIPEKHFTTLDHFFFCLYQMYAQVYLHPAAVKMEHDLCNVLKSADFKDEIDDLWHMKSGDEDLISSLPIHDKTLAERILYRGNKDSSKIMQIASHHVVTDLSLQEKGWEKIPTDGRALFKGEDQIYLYLRIEQSTVFMKMREVSLVVGSQNRFNPSVWCFYGESSYESIA